MPEEPMACGSLVVRSDSIIMTIIQIKKSSSKTLIWWIS